jgi:hypothetical protein
MAGDTSGVLQLATNGSTTAVTVDASQNVGIGTSSPTSSGAGTINLEIKGTTGRSNLQLNTGAADGDGVVTGTVTYLGGASTVGAEVRAALIFAATEGATSGNRGGRLVFNTKVNNGSIAERMRIDSNGAVMVGTTSAVGIFTATTLNATQRSIHASSNGGSTTTDGVYYSFVNQARGTGFNFMAFQNTSAVDFKVLGNGNVQNTNNSYGAISDVKLKENIVDATPKLDDLMKVKVRHYNFIDDESKTKQIGVVAQEVEQVFSGIIEEIPDRDEEGNTLDSVTKSVKYSVFVPMLIKAIQEQQTIINDLKARITALEGAA